MKPPVIVVIACAAAAVTACSTASSPAAQPARQAASRTAASSAGCKLKTTFDYLVRTTEPGIKAQAQEIGNVNYATCTPALQEFQLTAGTADGECTTIAKASANPGYKVNRTPATPLHGVIMSAGPGC